MREVLAESVPDQAMVQAVLDSKFDVQKALDLVLSQDSKRNLKTKDEDAVIVRKTTKGMLLLDCLHSRCFMCIYSLILALQAVRMITVALAIYWKS